MSPTPDPADPRPTLSATEADWHENVAGIRAAEAARQSGGDSATEALLDAAAGAVTIGGVTLNPPQAGTVWCLRKLAALLDGEPADIRAIATVHAFHDSAAAWNLCKSSREDVISFIQQWGFNIAFPDLKRMEDQIQRWLQELYGAKETVPDPTPAGAAPESSVTSATTPAPAPAGS